MAKTIKKTITIRINQNDFVKKYSQSQKGWSFSGWVQDQLDELMHHDSNQIKQMITEKEKTKSEVNQQIDKEIEQLKHRYEEQRKKEEEIQKRKQAATNQRHYDYGR